MSSCCVCLEYLQNKLEYKRMYCIVMSSYQIREQNLKLLNAACNHSDL